MLEAQDCSTRCHKELAYVQAQPTWLNADLHTPIPLSILEEYSSFLLCFVHYSRTCAGTFLHLCAACWLCSILSRDVRHASRKSRRTSTKRHADVEGGTCIPFYTLQNCSQSFHAVHISSTDVGDGSNIVACDVGQALVPACW